MNVPPAATSTTGSAWPCPGCNQWVTGAHACTGLPAPDPLERIAASLERIVALLEEADTSQSHQEPEQGL